MGWSHERYHLLSVCGIKVKFLVAQCTQVSYLWSQVGSKGGRYVQI